MSLDPGARLGPYEIVTLLRMRKVRPRRSLARFRGRSSARRAMRPPSKPSAGRSTSGPTSFSLGSVLYEMLTGQRAFARSSIPETLSAIIRDEPEPVAALNPSVPAPLTWILDRCLAKDPAERYASTQDLARELGTLRDHFVEATGAGPMALPAGSPTPGRVASRAAGPGRALGVAAIAVLLLGGAGVYLYRVVGRGEPPTQWSTSGRRGDASGPAGPIVPRIR